MDKTNLNVDPHASSSRVDEDFYDLVVEVVDALGTDWRTAPNGWGYNRVELKSIHGDVIDLHDGNRSHLKSQEGRVVITSDLTGLYCYTRKSAPTITVAQSRGPEVIAAEIQTRLLPGYREIRAEAQSAKDASDAVKAASLARLQRLAGALGGEVRGRYREDDNPDRVVAGEVSAVRSYGARFNFTVALEGDELVDAFAVHIAEFFATIDLKAAA